MYKRIIFYPYNIASASVTLLQKEIQKQFEGKVLRVYPDGNYKPRWSDLIINWGNSNLPEWDFTNCVNLPTSVKTAVDKLETFRKFNHARFRDIPKWTTDIETAKSWNVPVMARTKLKGHSGEGCYYFQDLFDIENMEWADDPIKLYVQYIPKIVEYRIHVFRGKVIDAQRKRKSREAMQSKTINKRIRSHNNGWIFARENCSPDNTILSLAMSAVSVLGLDFGAVDIIVDKRNKAYALEINTAPGLEGQTINSYANAIINLLNQD